jgi:hypothetical protein
MEERSMNGLPDFSGTVQREIDKKRGFATIEQAKSEYPVLNEQNMQYSVNPMKDKGFLEYYSGDETGSDEHPRPEEFEMGTPGLEIRDANTRPIDVAGDWASHEGIKTDPIIADHMRQFRESITPEQDDRLLQQFYHAQEKQNEGRSFEEWKEMSGIPGYFRGYAFDQWEHPEEMYTPEQMSRFDEMMKYLRQDGQ